MHVSVANRLESRESFVKDQRTTSSTLKYMANRMSTYLITDGLVTRVNSRPAFAFWAGSFIPGCCNNIDY